jgi:HTH-type transcriptional regulator/antitoxin HigA
MKAYQELLQEYAPRPIRNEKTCKNTLRTIDELMKRPRLSRAENELLDVLVALVEQYESSDYPTPANPPDRMLAHLIESKDVSQADVAAATGIPRSTLSAVLTKRRGISKNSALKLAAYFGVSPSVFLTPVHAG